MNKSRFLILNLVLGCTLSTLALPAWAALYGLGAVSTFNKGKDFKNSLVDQVLYNGKDLPGSPYKSMHQFVVKVSDKADTAQCAGVLIQERFVLFTAHCFAKMRDIKIEAALNENGSKWETIHGINFVQHDDALLNGGYGYSIPAYEANQIQDIGLILLARKPTWARPIKFLDDSMGTLGQYLNYTRLVGYQRTTKFEMTKTMGYIEFDNVHQIEQSNYALYYISENRGMCRGDSGGPTVITIRGEHYLVGITSAYKGQAFTELPYSTFKNANGQVIGTCSRKVILMHTGKHVEWIRSSMKQLIKESQVSTPTTLDVYNLQ